MPQLQVIQRQEDPTIKALSQAGTDIADSIQKAQALKLSAQYYKLLGKNAETDAKKFEYERKAKGAEYIADVMKNVKDPQQRGLALRVAIDSGIIDMGIVEDTGSKAAEYHKILTQKTPLEEAELAGKEAETAQTAQIAELLRRQLSGGGTTPSEGGASGTPAGEGSNLVIPSMNVNGVNITDINAAARIKAAEAAASAEGSYLGQKSAVKKTYGDVIDNFDQIASQIKRPKGDGSFMEFIGYPARNAAIMSGAMKGTAGEANLLRLYDGAFKNLGTFIARMVDVGNLNQTEQEAGRLLVPDKADSENTHKLKMAYIRDLVDPVERGDASRVKQLINEFASKIKTRPEVASQTAQPGADARINALGGPSTPTKVGDFIIQAE